MTQDEIIEMARQAGMMDTWDGWVSRSVYKASGLQTEDLEAFAKLVAAKEREKWSDIVVDQRLRLQALNEIIGGEDSTTTGNILSYSRWEMRLEDAVKEEREACLKICEAQAQTNYWEGADVCADAIRARGQA